MKKKVLVIADVCRVPSASEWYQSKEFSLFSVAEEKEKFHHAAQKRKAIA
jgi:hypothetical protein